jgi:hypothetical protein
MTQMMSEGAYDCFRMVLAFGAGAFSALVFFVLWGVCAMPKDSDERAGRDE